MFFVVKGKLKIELRDKTVILNESEFLVIPKCIEHKPIAEEEVHLILFEPASTLNTGNALNEITKTTLEKFNNIKITHINHINILHCFSL